MSLKFKFIILGATLIIICGFTAWLNYQNNQIVKEQHVAVEVVQRHMDADMKHDGIRGNVYSALVASKTGNAEMLKASQDEVVDMSNEFSKNVNDNIAADIPDNIRQQFRKIKTSVADYAAFSQKITQEAQDFDVAVYMLPQFDEVFTVLEEDQGKATEMILAWSASLSEDAENMSRYLQIALVILFFLAVGLPVFAILAIFKPIEGMVEAMEQLSEGDTSIEIPYTERSDEIGIMAGTLQVFKENAQKISQMHQEQEAQKIEAEKQKRAAMHQMADEFETSVKDVVSQVAASAVQMRAGAESVTKIADDTKQRSLVVVDASNEAANTSSQVAAAAEELTASIKEISAQTQKSSQVANEAAAKAEFAKDAIHLLSEKSMRVGAVIEVITGIASQINLLALNATIESARAGEAGKGFAVVASEVKNLANQVGKATGEITQQINEMQGATKNSVDSVMQILSIIHQVSENTSTVAAAVEEQSAVTNEISRNVSRTSSGTQEISRNMGNVQNGADQTGATASEVLQSAQNLSAQSDVLKRKVDEFLNTIRAA